MGFNALGAIQNILQNASTTVNKDLNMQMLEEQFQQEQMQQTMAQEAAANANLPNAGNEGTTSSSSISSAAIGLSIGGACGAIVAGLVAIVVAFLVIGSMTAAVFGIGLLFLLLAAVIAVAIFAIVEACKSQPKNSSNDGFTTKGPEVTQYDTGKQTEAQNVISQLAALVSQIQQKINQQFQQFVSPDQQALTALENMWNNINQNRQQLVGNW